jgi:hypothetical protein
MPNGKAKPAKANGDEPEETTGRAASDWRNRMTITIPEYARLMRVGRNTAYQAARVGDVKTIKVGGRILVCVPALLRQLEGGK